MAYPPDDPYDYYGQPYGGRRRGDSYLYPEYGAPGPSGLYRSRSQGHRPAPAFAIYNDYRDQAPRSASRSPPYPQVRYSPEVRGRQSRLGDELAEEIADMVLDRARSRSRGRSDAALDRPDYRDWELMQKEKELREIQRREQWEREEKRLKDSYEMQRIKDDAKRKADEDAAKADRKRIIEEYELKQREDEEHRKAEEKRIKDKIEREKQEAADKEKRDWEEFLRKQREKDDKEKEEKRKEKEKIDEATRKRLAEAGLSHAAIERVMIDEKEKKKEAEMQLALQHTPRHFKISRKYLDVTTVKLYDIPYYLSEDGQYIVITCTLDQGTIDVLCDHTRRTRAGDKTLLLEAPKKKALPRHSFFRKREPSTGRVREGILTYTN